MKVRVETVGILNTGPIPEDGIELPEGATLETLYKKLGFKKIHFKYITANVNGNEVPPATRLSDGDKIKLFMPVGGG